MVRLDHKRELWLFAIQRVVGSFVVWQDYDGRAFVYCSTEKEGIVCCCVCSSIQYGEVAVLFYSVVSCSLLWFASVQRGTIALVSVGTDRALKLFLFL